MAQKLDTKSQKIDQPPEEQEEEKKAIVVDEESNAMWKKLNEQANADSRATFEEMLRTDEWRYNGETYSYSMVKRADQAKLLKLLSEAASLDKEDFMRYSDNIMKRACIVIDGMTPDKFEQEEYEFLETLTVAWSLKIRGFRKFKQGA